MADAFANDRVQLDSPYAAGAAVTPHDTNDLGTVTRALWVGGTGNVKVNLVGGGTVTLVGAVGEVKVRCTRVYDTDTTATSIVALW